MALWYCLMLLLLMLFPLYQEQFQRVQLLTHLKCSLPRLSSSGSWRLLACCSSLHVSAEHHQPALHLHCSGQSLRTHMRIRAHCPSLDELLFGLVCPGIDFPLSPVTHLRIRAHCPSLDELLFELVCPGIGFPLALVTRLRIPACCSSLDELLLGPVSGHWLLISPGWMSSF